MRKPNEAKTYSVTTLQNDTRRRLGMICASAIVALGIGVTLYFTKTAQAQDAATKSGKYLVYVGTYTAKGSSPTGSKGIYAYRFDAGNGKIEPVGLVGESDQPSFLAADPAQKFLFAVNETDKYKGQETGGVSAFSMNRSSGKLTFLNEIASRGSAPAHIAVDRTGRYVAVSNYNGGNLAVFPIGADGKLGEATAFDQHHGSSVNKDRQSSPHVHEAIFSPDNRFILSADLGMDDIFVYPFDAKNGTLGTPHTVSVTGGLGPRHMTFSPDGKFVYLVSEMGSAVTVLSYDAPSGSLVVRQTVPLAPTSDTPQQKAGAEIAVGRSGKFLYASNRFDNLIGVYAINPDTGMIEQTERVALEGKTPRDFAIDPSGTWFWDANQDSDGIVIYKIDQANGTLTASGTTLKVAAPTCVLFVPIL
jgi:6-phosphogluconolactonase